MVIFQFAKNLSLPEGIDAHPCGGMDGRSWRSLRSWGQGTQKWTTIRILKAGEARPRAVSVRIAQAPGRFHESRGKQV